MNSSRKSSVARHIGNVHAGKAMLLSYSDYLAGLRGGLYVPQSPPSYTPKKEPDYETIMREEFCREMARIFATGYSNKTAQSPELSPLLLKAFSHFVKDVVKAVRQ